MNCDGSEIALNFESVSKRFAKHAAISELSLKFKAGRVIGLVGPNGAGKSTILKLAFGILRPSAGEVFIDGMNVYTNRSQVRQSIGYVPEVHRMYSSMTAHQVLRLAAAMRASWDSELEEEFIDRFSIPLHHRVCILSRGMVGKLALLIGIAHRPKVLLLDEPISGLDPCDREEFIEAVIQAPTRNDQLVVFSSHQLDELQSFAHELAVVDRGSLLCHASIVDIVSGSRNVDVECNSNFDPSRLPSRLHLRYCRQNRARLVAFNCAESDLETLVHDRTFRVLAIGESTLDDIYKVLVGERRK